MMNMLFDIPSKSFFVEGGADGTLTWSNYDGAKVDAVFLSDDRSRRIVLLCWDATRKHGFENQFCVDRDGNTRWTDERRDKYDRYVAAEMKPDGLHAWSWSAYQSLIDGRVIGMEFTK
jgi:hypothetical protein